MDAQALEECPTTDTCLSTKELVAMVKHEAMNALNIIVGHASYLRSSSGRRGSEAPEDRQLLASAREIETEAMGLAALLNSLYLLSDEGAVVREPLLLQRFLPRLVAATNYQRPGSKIVLHVPQDLPPVLASETLFTAVMQNVLSNAEKYSSCLEPIEVQAALGEGFVCLRVRDYGRGVAAEELDSIFRLFYRSEESSAGVKGSGVGLAMCKKLTEAMGGRIWAELPDGPGFEIAVSLGLADDACTDR